MRNGTRLLILFVAAISLAMAAESSAGTVKGKISAQGAGEPAKINVNKDQAICGAKPLFKENAPLVSKSGGLRNAVVEIIGTGGAKPGKVTLTQKGCRFEPHVHAIITGSSIDVKNDDGISHNFHSYAFENESVNFAQPGDMKVKMVKGASFAAPEVVQIKCDIHEWMNAWIVVSDNTAVAVTGPEGEFTILGVKPGNYKVKVWHETLGVVQQDITVKDADTVFNLTMKK